MPTAIDSYLAQLRNPAAKKSLTALRAQLKGLLPTATETISYGMPAFRLESGKVAAGFAFFGKRCGLYPHSGNVIPKLGKQLAGYQTSTGGITFAPEAPLPLSVVKAVVKLRLQEIAQAKPLKKEPLKKKPLKKKPRGLRQR